jgi:hypothetical protein
MEYSRFFRLASGTLALTIERKVKANIELQPLSPINYVLAP